MEIFKSLLPLEEGITYFFRRSEVIQGNIANVDTPNYIPKDLIFEKEFKKNISLKRTDPKHMDPYFTTSVKFKEIKDETYSGYDSNEVNLDRELAKFAESNVMIKALNEILRKEIGKIKLAIQGR
jgi:flagellar basal-body rod protein FlgB